MTIDFPEFINPISPSEFATCYRGQQPGYFPGSLSRCGSFPTIDEILSMLSRRPFPPDVIRIRQSQSIPTEDIFVPLPNSTWRCIRTDAVARHLEAGATLVWESCETWLDGVNEICVMLSKALSARVYAGLFLVYLPQKPGPLHWDNRDIFVCQLAGSKQWPLYKPVYPSPTISRRRVDLKWQESDLELVEEVTLNPGDGLYLPRGWIHNPSAAETPSMHISFTVASPTGGELLEWVCQELIGECPEVRADLPLELSTDKKAQFARTLRQLVINKLDLGTLERYCASYYSDLFQPPLLPPPREEARQCLVSAEV